MFPNRDYNLTDCGIYSMAICLCLQISLIWLALHPFHGPKPATKLSSWYFKITHRKQPVFLFVSFSYITFSLNMLFVSHFLPINLQYCNPAGRKYEPMLIPGFVDSNAKPLSHMTKLYGYDRMTMV